MSTVRPRVELSSYLRVGPSGTTVAFADLLECSPGELHEGTEVLVTSHAMNLAGYAKVLKILHHEERLVLDLNWSGLKPLRRR